MSPNKITTPEHSFHQPLLYDSLETEVSCEQGADIRRLLEEDREAMREVMKQHSVVSIFDPLLRRDVDVSSDVKALRNRLKTYREIATVGGYCVNPSGYPNVHLASDGRVETLTVNNAGILFFDIKKSTVRAREIPRATGHNVMEFYSGHFFSHVRDLIGQRSHDWDQGYPLSFGGDAMHVMLIPDKQEGNDRRIVLNGLDKACILGMKITALAAACDRSIKHAYPKIAEQFLEETFLQIRTAITQDNVCIGDPFTLDRSLQSEFEVFQKEFEQECKNRGLPYRHPRIPGGVPAWPANSLSPGQNEAAKIQSVARHFEGFICVTTEEYLSRMSPALQRFYAPVSPQETELPDGTSKMLYGLPKDLDYRDILQACTEFYAVNRYH